ncbi:hypothetical protein [Desulfohalobium retbaense]|uniref:Uncharacterized protein n=1 Tax=Desulfohalobium retbaense (strain ATCC 49708 / DSM 5692 / JCM 16813 / HR100) TaxID=485915 RepID=C8X1U2_DESRD|nr:hypothetical protein [Desulfohalobium retbaense]ACV68514.1 hypothetical protein Dret_1226 [Desulfohalobium retbaense DSM 5692]
MRCRLGSGPWGVANDRDVALPPLSLYSLRALIVRYKRYFCLLVWTCCLFWATGAVAQSVPADDSAPCPVVAPGDYAASVSVSPEPGRVNEPVTLSVRLTPAEPPEGFFVSTLVSVVQGPAGPSPTIAPGFPDTRFTATVPGEYVLEVRANMITKSSCGGVESWELLSQRIALKIASAPKSE